MVKRISGWLKRPPIEDPVDRRNAPMMQIILLLIGTLPPLAWAFRVAAPARPITAGEWIVMAASLTLSVVAWVCFALIRRGRFRPAVILFLVVGLGNMIVAYVGGGYAASSHELPLYSIWMIIAGLVLGRRALWLAYLITILAFGLGTMTDILSPANEDPWIYHVLDTATAAVIFLIIAVVLDRTIAALRESLSEAKEGQHELTLVNSRLHREIEEREQAQEQLIHAQKMKAVGQLARGVAHDFKNVLNVVLGLAARRNKMSDLDTAQHMLAAIEGAARRGSETAQRLLGLARPHQTRIDTFEASEAVREAIPLIRQTFNDGVRIEEANSETPAPIRFDRSQFDLMLLNIAANARDAMPDGGRFSIALGRNESEDHVELRLTDTGIGMDEEIRARLFEPFFTTKPDGEGYGLGLALVKSLVTEAGGTIAVESAPWRGTTVLIQLPIANEATHPT